MRRRIVGIGLLFLWACGAPTRQDENDTAEVEAAATAFVQLAHAYEYSALRAAATADAEVMLFGRRMNLDAYEALLRNMEQEGVELPGVEGLEFATKVSGDVAYTSWQTGNWLEMTILRRSGDRWLVDRTSSMRMQPQLP